MLDQVNLKQARIWVKRSKNSLDTEQAIEGDELRALKRYLASRKDKLPWLWLSERGQPMTRQRHAHRYCATHTQTMTIATTTLATGQV